MWQGKHQEHACNCSGDINVKHGHVFARMHICMFEGDF